MSSRFAIPLLFGVGVLVAPTSAMACTDDVDCGGCGVICSWAVTPHVCVTAANSTDPGWCSVNTDCACSGQTCVGTSCSPSYDDNCAPCNPMGCDGGIYLFLDGGDPTDAGICPADAGSTTTGTTGGTTTGAATTGASTTGAATSGAATTTGGATTGATIGGTTTAGGTTTGAGTTGGASTAGTAGSTGGTTGATAGTSGAATSGGATTGGGTSGGGTTGGGTTGSPGAACTTDKDCGTVCGMGGFVCSYATNPPQCVAWGTDDGWCNSPNDCVCPGQICDYGQHCYPSDPDYLNASTSSSGTTSGGSGGSTGSGGGCDSGSGGAFGLTPLLAGAALIWLVTRAKRAKRQGSN